MANIKCPYCDSDSTLTPCENILKYDCKTCGKYFLCNRYGEGETFGYETKNKFASYLFYTRDTIKNRFLGTKEEYEKAKNKFTAASLNLITSDEIEAFWPRSFSDKITKILLWIDSKSSHFGEAINVSYNEFYRLAFIDTEVSDYEIEEQYRFFLKYFNHNKKYIYMVSNEKTADLSLTSEGYERIEELQLSKHNNKKVFVSMAFNENTENIREAIKKGIVEAKYDATLIDEIIHNKQIVPEMFRLIRESRLLVMDISEPNYGAYYEAGYAQGLGKEVIITCSEERFYKKYETEEEQKYEKYLKPHFDIAQKQILLWKDTEDLTNKLSEWIKAIE